MAKYSDHWTEAAATEAEKKPPTRPTGEIFPGEHTATADLADESSHEYRWFKALAKVEVRKRADALHLTEREHTDVLEMLGLAGYVSLRENPYYDPDREVVCATCRESKRVGEYSRSRNHVSGMKPDCRPCSNELRREQYQRERERGTHVA